MPDLSRLSAEECDDYIAALADVLCWFRGFKAAKGSKVEFPPGLDRLRDLNIDIKRAAEKRGAKMTIGSVTYIGQGCSAEFDGSLVWLQAYESGRIIAIDKEALAKLNEISPF